MLLEQKLHEILLEAKERVQAGDFVRITLELKNLFKFKIALVPAYDAQVPTLFFVFLNRVFYQTLRQC